VPELEYHNLETLRRHHPAWRLLAAVNAPLIIGFLDRAFIRPNVRAIPHGELASRLEDYLYNLRRELGEEAFPKLATDYLSDWTAEERGWLRKYYPVDSDEPHYDVTPATEKAIEWLTSLQERHFVGAESRLLTIFELLRQMVHGSETDPAARIAELEERRSAIDAEIERVRAGELELMDPTQLRERFFQMEQTARALLADFRQVEQNFRNLDRVVREQITTWGGSKGELLGRVFGERDAITDSDQGKSFHAFWDFLMSPHRQELLSELLERVLSLEAVAELEPDRRLLRIHYDWLEAGEMAQRTVARLSEQLRKYLDDQAWLENRRIMDIIRNIEQQALQVRDNPPAERLYPGRDGMPARQEAARRFMELDETAPAVNLIMDRPLFRPPEKPHISQQAIAAGNEALDTSALFEQAYVDRARLNARVRQALQTREQVALSTLLDLYPLEQGLTELVTYLSLAADDSSSIIDETRREQVTWVDENKGRREATMPMVIFAR